MEALLPPKMIYYKEDISDKGGNVPQALEKQLDALEARINK